MPSPNTESTHHVCTNIFKKNVATTSSEPKIEQKETSQESQETAAQKVRRKALEDKEAYIQMIIKRKGVLRSVAEIEYDDLIGSI